MAGKAPLHKTTHWRRMREAIRLLCDYEHIDYTKYDLNKINCRSSYGNLFYGTNVSYDIANRTRSYFVSDNAYDVFEIPHITNRSTFHGDYLVLIHNTSFDYWLFGYMEVRLNRRKSIENNMVFDSYHYDILGHYDINLKSSNKITFYKNRQGDNIDWGMSNPNIRCTASDRKKAYRITDSDILNFLGISNKNLTEKNNICIYNKNRTRKSRF